MRHLDIVNLEREQLLGEDSDIDGEIVKYNTTLSNISGSIKTAQEKISETSKQVNGVSIKMETFNQKIVDLKLKQTTLNARLENSNNSLRRLAEFQIDSQQHHEQLVAEITGKHQKKNISKNKMIACEQTLSEMYESIKILEQIIASNEEDFDKIDAKLKNNDSIISEIQGKREKVLEKLRLLELEQNQRSLQRNNITSRLEELYHKPFSEYRSELDRLSSQWTGCPLA